MKSNTRVVLSTASGLIATRWLIYKLKFDQIKPTRSDWIETLYFLISAKILKKYYN